MFTEYNKEFIKMCNARALLIDIDQSKQLQRATDLGHV